MFSMGNLGETLQKPSFSAPEIISPTAPPYSHVEIQPDLHPISSLPSPG